MPYYNRDPKRNPNFDNPPNIFDQPKNHARKLTPRLDPNPQNSLTKQHNQQQVAMFCAVLIPFFSDQAQLHQESYKKNIETKSLVKALSFDPFGVCTASI